MTSILQQTTLQVLKTHFFFVSLPRYSHMWDFKEMAMV